MGQVKPVADAVHAILDGITPKLIESLRKLSEIGLTEDTIPTDARQKAAYAKIRLDATKALLKLRFGTKARGPLMPPEDDAEDAFFKMSEEEQETALQKQIEDGTLTEAQADYYRDEAKERRDAATSTQAETRPQEAVPSA